MHRCSQRGRRGSGLEGLPPSMWAAEALFSAVAELLVTHRYHKDVILALLCDYYHSVLRFFVPYVISEKSDNTIKDNHCRITWAIGRLYVR